MKRLFFFLVLFSLSFIVTGSFNKVAAITLYNGDLSSGTADQTLESFDSHWHSWNSGTDLHIVNPAASSFTNNGDGVYYYDLFTSTTDQILQVKHTTDLSEDHWFQLFYRNTPPLHFRSVQFFINTDGSGSLKNEWGTNLHSFSNGYFSNNTEYTFTIKAIGCEYEVDINDTPIISEQPIIGCPSDFTTGSFGIETNDGTILHELSFANTASSDIEIVTFPSNGNITVGTPFTVNVRINDEADEFNAARANVAVSSNLSITGIHAPTSNACDLQYTQTPTTSNPSFAGGIFGGSSTGCTVYTMTLTPTATGTGTITFTNASVKSYDDNSEILTGVENGSFTITDGPTPTPTPILEFQVTNVLQTYKTNFDLTGTKLSTITKIFVNGSDANSTYPTSTTWQNAVTLALGANNFTLYGADNEENQTATQTVTVSRHTLGDINGDEVVDLIDASLFAVDWDKTENLTYNLSDMNDDGVVDLTDLSILAKLIQ